jgi:hypothetical protein
MRAILFDCYSPVFVHANLLRRGNEHGKTLLVANWAGFGSYVSTQALYSEKGGHPMDVAPRLCTPPHHQNNSAPSSSNTNQWFC